MNRDEKKIIGIISKVLNADVNEINLKSDANNVKNAINADFFSFFNFEKQIFILLLFIFLY